MTKIFELAEFVSNSDHPAPNARRAAARAVYDLIGVAAAGSRTSGGIAARRAARNIWSNGAVRVWFATDETTAAGAAFVNSVYASMLDLDDGHRLAAGHPGAAIVPAVLAVAQTVDVTTQQILDAIVFGYEIGTRVSASRDFRTLRTTDTGQWCGYGVAAALGRLGGLEPQVIAHAMAIAGHTACGQFATGWTKVGHMAKEGIAWATAGAITAVHLAQEGFTGPIDLLDDPDRYDQAKLIGGLGKEWAIEASYLKIYSSCRWAHGPVDAVLSLQEQHGITTENIQAIEIATFGRALTLINATAPDKLEAAQYSIPFSVALAAVRGADALLLPDVRYLKDREVLALAAKVTLACDPELDSCFPAATPCRITLRHKGGVARMELLAPRGEPSNPLKAKDVSDKFMKLAVPTLGTKHAARLEQSLSKLEYTSSMASTLELLSPSENDTGEASRLFSELATG
ncbi:MmgE/PrpD family protein [Aliirhizobium smilacinae]|uniref:MmgE/PrpD family protein n=1 Tax=Aliirhizobium smilacinae TaxID=1395944 RepID=A0A5C4XS30_9HYPH|nr:MmgE/PrpD family protein [Rhizobium smilacinae]TNM65370.1 MmgE/PrpD family protein [Rhizobium smilacinae]